MITLLASGFRRFLNDPVGAMEDFRDSVPTVPIAVMALLAALLVHVVVDYIYGAYTWPHTFLEGGKRSNGPVLGTLVPALRLIAMAVALWIGIQLFYKEEIPAALAIWMIVPSALAEIGLDMVEILTVVFFVLTDVDLYGEMFYIGFIGQVLVLVLSVKVLLPARDWLSSLPLAVFTFLGKFVFFTPLMLLFLPCFILWKKIR